MGDSVCITLTTDEALVLSEFLTRFSRTDTLNIEHQAEAISLWNLQCLLEKQSLIPVDAGSDWTASLAAARARLSTDE